MTDGNVLIAALGYKCALSGPSEPDHGNVDWRKAANTKSKLASASHVNMLSPYPALWDIAFVPDRSVVLDSGGADEAKVAFKHRLKLKQDPRREVGSASFHHAACTHTYSRVASGYQSHPSYK